MRVRVLAFAVLRDRLGFSEKLIELPEGATVATAATAVLGSPPPAGVAYAVNQVYATPQSLLADGDELALLPPVSGGAPLFRVQSQPIDIEEVVAAVRDPECGAVLTFLGTAREVPGDRLVHLSYEAYPAMAERFFAELGETLRSRFGVRAVAIVHRTGDVAVAEISIAIALSTPHRGEGFEALRHAIEHIKEKAPVWKKEITERGERWIAVEKMEGG